MEMIFESRKLKPYGEFMKSCELVEGEIYFRVSFLDEDMLIPEMIPLVFIGRDLQPNGPGLYFQDASSFMTGERYSSDNWVNVTEEELSDNIHFGHRCWFEIMENKEYASVLSFEKAIDQLLKCSLKRSKSLS